MESGTLALIFFCVVIAVIGAWDTSKTRHNMESHHRRRRSDT